MAIRAAWGVAALLELASPALAEDCRLALVLALDVSASMDRDDDRLQRDGLAQALVAPEVVRAFLSDAPVALYAFQWSGVSAQTPLLPGWVVVRSEEDLARIAGVIAASHRMHVDYLDGTTALGAALIHAALALREAPDCRAWKVDVSGDGWNNAGIEPGIAYMILPFEEVTVNALVTSDGPRTSAELVSWYRTHVLHGPGAFLVLADDYDDYARAMEAKLLRELELPVVGGRIMGAAAG